TCDDGLFCNGAETFDGTTCQPGTDPCDDGVVCTVDVCDETLDTCTNTADNTLCDDGGFCNGAETCDPALDCQAGTNPCDDGVGCTVDVCDEILNSCTNTADNTLCDDGLFCNGAETCDPALDCQAGTDPCDDGVACTVDTCDETGDTCTNTADDTLCDDGLFCNGAETCDPVLDCQAGTDPCDDGVACTVDTCDEGADTCANTADDTLCDDGLFCNGPETCDAALDCQAGIDPCDDGVACTVDVCDEVANACEAHYRPLGPSDEVPAEPVSVAVALADKIDMLTGFWVINERPTGSKDPFALRRAALGIVRIILESSLRIALEGVIKHAMIPSFRTYTKSPGIRYALLAQLSDESCPEYLAEIQIRRASKQGMLPSFTEEEVDQMWEAANQDGFQEGYTEDATKDLLSFFADRLKVHLRDQGIRHDVIQACFDLGGQDDLVFLVNRVRALQDFLETQDGEHLLVAYRRAANIVGIEEKRDGVEYSGTPEAKFAEQDEERALFNALDAAEPAIAAALEAEDFAAAMAEMAKLRPVIDTFFDKVTVNAENAIVRRNRLCLLNRIRAVMRQVAVWEAIEG
ncbi:MAG: glycine--tRNA ligase subunit beta, partial [Proteobacteria bacterium]|nr:glycine--tRNA ligase subunit beta [Pseudomonadota bacterium]